MHEVQVEAQQPAGQEQQQQQHLEGGGGGDAVAGAVEDRQRHSDERGSGGGGGGAGKPSSALMNLDISSFKLPADAVLKQEIPLPRRMASCVIGIKGQSVGKLRRESGSKIHVRPAQGRDEMDQVVEIEGPIESVSSVLACLVALW